MSASTPTGKKAANSDTNTPVITVITCGVWYFGWTLDSTAGSRPSRLITKKMRVWPNIIIRMTEGRARPAARPIRLPTWGQPIERRVQARASFEQTTAASPAALQAAVSSGLPGRRPAPLASVIGWAPTVPITPEATRM